MKTYRIVGVPEHFNYPFRILSQTQPFEQDGVKIQWIEESRGSGQMALDLKNDEADMAIMLTESFMKEFESGSPFKMLGFHVQSPLNWGIHVGCTHSANLVEEIQSRHFLVSRMGSGSHLMAMVLADKMGWEKESLTFEIVGNMEGAKKAFSSGNPGIFLWEKYTTAPEVKAQSMKRIGELPSPWPCFVIVVNEKAIQEFPELILQIRSQLYSISRSIKSQTGIAETLASEYHLALEDVKSWLTQTQWTTEAEINAEDLSSAIGQMIHYGIVSGKLRMEDFLLSTGLRVIS